MTLAGYSDIEVALLQEARLIGPSTTIVTTVHSLQVVDDELPETKHDFSVDLIVTPDKVIECPPITCSYSRPQISHHKIRACSTCAWTVEHALSR